MMDLAEHWGMFSALNIFLHPSPDLYFSITFFAELLGVFFYLHGEVVAGNTAIKTQMSLLLQSLETHLLHSGDFHFTNCGSTSTT